MLLVSQIYTSKPIINEQIYSGKKKDIKDKDQNVNRGNFPVSGASVFFTFTFIIKKNIYIF